MIRGVTNGVKAEAIMTPDDSIALTSSRWSGVKSDAANASDIPSRPFKGVRISCDIIARNIFLARIASSSIQQARHRKIICKN